MRALVVAALTTSLLGCLAVIHTQPVEPHPPPIVTDTDLCDAAEAKLIELKCPEGQPTKRGERFGDVCRELQTAGVFVNPRCLSTLTSCAGVDACTGTVKPPS